MWKLVLLFCFVIYLFIYFLGTSLIQNVLKTWSLLVVSLTVVMIKYLFPLFLTTVFAIDYGIYIC